MSNNNTNTYKLYTRKTIRRFSYQFYIKLYFIKRGLNIFNSYQNSDYRVDIM